MISSSHYDVIIIGAGLSGLASAIRLAQYGKKVCLLEKHSLLGGLNSFYNKSGYAFDVGLHAMTNYCLKNSPRHQALPRVLRQLKIAYHDLELIPQGKSLISSFNLQLEFNNNIDFFIEQVSKLFPKEKDAFIKLIKFIQTKINSPIENTPFTSTRKRIKKFINSPELIEMILCPILFYGSATENDIDFSQFCIIFSSIFLEGFCRPIKGMRQVIKILKNRFLNSNGILKISTKVNLILHKNKKIYGIITEKGEKILAKKIISSIGLYETYKLANLRSNWIKKGNLSFVESIFILDKNPQDFNIKHSIQFINKNKSHFSYQAPKNELVDFQSTVLCCPQNFAFPKNETHKNYTLRLTHLSQQKQWFQLDENEYKAQKKNFIKKQCKNFLPQSIKKHIIFVDAFTPRTIHHYTGHHKGVIYGTNTKQKDGRTSLENLFLCGTDQGLLGIVGSLLSGIIIANTYALKD